jgi:hydroxyacylglutathione hydrolase
VRPDQTALAVDIPDGDVLLGILARDGLRLTDVLFTHTHHDHVDKAAKVFEVTGCQGWGPKGAELPVPFLPLSEGAQDVAGFSMRILDTSGHSELDFSYYLENLNVCFCGDTLFDGGCGRMFAGPTERFWQSIQAFRMLPEETLLCVGHDYAGDNYRFATSILPDMPIFHDQGEQVRSHPLSERMPVTLGKQIRANPFLMCDHPPVAAALGMPGEAPSEVFAKMRDLKNRF